LEQKGLKGRALNVEVEKYRWNYVEDKKYPCNETKTLIASQLKKTPNIAEVSLTRDVEQKLWHIIYSVTDKAEYEKALRSFAKKNQLDESSFVDVFKKFPPFKSEYGAYSEKAVKKLLPLMRLGKHWSWNAIDEKSKTRMDKILTGEYDENIKNRAREKTLHLTQKTDFQGLQLWLAQYIVYGHHSEAAFVGKWNSATDLALFLKEFKQYSLRNPIVEQIVTETLRVVKDIWIQYGNGSKDFFNEIHIELGREMKNTAEDRERISNQVAENENTNLRVKALLAELKNDGDVENVRPFSPMQQEILKVYEEGVLNSNIEIEDDILKISKTAQPSSADLKRYKLWLEQKYRSPYTGQIIPLNKLFTPEYEIEHIIPQSRYFDNSFGNKIICEAPVNKLKDNQLGYEFVKKHHGEKVQFGNKTVQILEVKAYEDFVKEHYSRNRSKRNKLLLEEIPDKMIERQLNDTRYVSKFISSILSNIVRVETNDDGINSKNLIPGSGKITNELKQDWGLNDAWNDLILPRFERMNQLTNSTHFTAWSENHQKYLPTVPLELSKGFSKKRIDHRHHAMDALIIACATRDHINLLNNKHAKSKERFDLNRKLRKFEKTVYNHPKTNERVEKEVPKDFIKPWNNFTTDAKNALENIVVSYKQNLRVINKATNNYEKWGIKDGVKVKEEHEQKVTNKGTNWAVRKSMHKAFVFGKINLKRIKTPKGKIVVAIRRGLDPSVDLDKITDTAIQKILRNYLTARGNNLEIAFSPEGIEEMNKNIALYNEGKPHQPIHKIRTFEVGERFSLGNLGNKKDKYVETADGTNLFFAIYTSKQGTKRMFETVPLNEVIEYQKQRASEKVTGGDRNLIPIKKVLEDESEAGEVDFLFALSPYDLVYIPTDDEKENINRIDFGKLSIEQIKRIFIVNDFSSTCYFTPNHLAKNIAPKEVDLRFDTKKNKLSGSYDTKTASFEGKQIKDECFKIKVDRLGNVRLV
jgi:CRISPR-associated endonuclease Csn1